jgi:hypothetical protein
MQIHRWLSLSAVLVLLGVTGAAQREIVDEDSLTAGVATRALYERAPCGYRVTWVNWDSPFRAVGLRLGDVVTAMNGANITCPPREDAGASPELQRFTQFGLGGISETLTWKKQGLRDGSSLTLSVLRRAVEGSERLEIRGAVRNLRRYTSASNARLLDRNGPAALEKDGFNQNWEFWYEDWKRFAERALLDGWVNRMDSRRLLTELLQYEPRVSLLERKYPGAFAQNVRSDYEATRAVLEGEVFEIKASDLEYRQLGEKRAAQVASAAKQSWAATLESVKSQVIPAFPSVNPLEARDKVVGKLVVLGPIKSQDWVSDAGRCFLRAGDHTKGLYFVDCQNPAVRRLYEAQFRYQRSVNPKLNEVHSFIARILDTPRMLIVDNRAAIGLMVEPLVVKVSEAMVVDLRVNQNGTSPYSGEASLMNANLEPPPDTASPRQVMDAMIAALKWGDEKRWGELFADVEIWEENGRIGYSPRRYGPKLADDWVKSRRQILEGVFDVRVTRVSEPRTIVTPQIIKGAPTVQEVTLEVRHVGRFDGVYRSFVNLTLNPVWRLQRRDAGPWRIITDQSI